MWHKDLIFVLPRQQLVAQYREACSIAKSWDEAGTPNHILVNKVLDYSVCHLFTYTCLIKDEMTTRGYKTRKDTWDRFYNHCLSIREKESFEPLAMINYPELYADWHNNRYFKQCYYNLQEKYDCYGITKEEWEKIVQLEI